MDITYRVPSKKVPYGYVEVTWEKADSVMPDPVALAQDYAQFIKDYQAAEVAAFEQPTKFVDAKPKAAKPEPDINDVAADEIKSQLGATEIDGDDPNAPWNEGDETTKTSTVSVDDAAWDFDD